MLRIGLAVTLLMSAGCGTSVVDATTVTSGSVTGAGSGGSGAAVAVAASSGDVSASSGDMSASSGDMSASSGDMSASSGDGASVSSSSSAGGGALVCVPGTVQPCYGGPPETEGVGICVGGQQTCVDDGSDYGPCEGQVLPAVDDCSTPVDEDCTPATCPVALAWAKTFGESISLAHAYGVAVDPAGNVIIVGSYGGPTLDLGGPPLQNDGGEDAFVLKLDPVGSPVWSRKIGGSMYQAATRVAADASGNVIVAGVAVGGLVVDGQGIAGSGGIDAFVIKLDASGDLVWARVGTGSSNGERRPHGLAIDPSGDVVAAGEFSWDLSFDSVPVAATGQEDVFVVRFEAATGNTVWLHTLPNPGDQQGGGLAVDAQGHITLVGQSYMGPLDFGGGPSGGTEPALFAAQFDDNAIFRWSDAVAGTTSAVSSAAVDSTGAIAWSGACDQPVDFGSGPLPLGDDAFVAKLSPDGGLLWSRDFAPALGQSRANGVATSAVGDIAVAGWFSGEIDFGLGKLTAEGQTGFVVKLDAGGNTLWSAKLGGAIVVPEGVAVDASGAVLTVGDCFDSIDFWGTTFSAPSGGGIFVAKLGP